MAASDPSESDPSESDPPDPSESDPPESDPDPRAYLFALAPVVVVVAVGPALALAVPAPVTAPVPTPGWVPMVALVVAGRAAVVAGAALVAAGLGLVAWALRAFARAGEPPSPASPPGRLVTAGPLSRTRNPVYLGTVAAAAGEALAFRSVVLAVYAAALWGVYHLLVVYREEPELRAALGEAYEDYAERVPRWIRVR